MSASEAENSHGSARPGEPGAGTPYKAGQSGNPSGRPKGLARKVREVLGDDDGETIARFLAAVMSGEVVTVTVDEKTGEQKQVRTRANVKERVEAAKLLAERGWGKPAQFVPIEEDDPLGLSEAAADESAAELDAEFDELAAARQRRETAPAAG